MTEQPLTHVRREKTIDITTSDLPLCCPLPNEPRALLHPRVFLDPTVTGRAVCPYCSREYRLTAPLPKDHR